MSLATHRAALVALISGLADIGQVHDEEPYGKSEADFRRLYAWQPPTPSNEPQPATQIRGWFVRRVRTVERELGVARVHDVHTWQIKGFLALQPPDSGKAFDDLIEALRAAVRADPTLGGALDPGPLGQPSGVQVADSGPVLLAGALCHGCTLTLDTHDYL